MERAADPTPRGNSAFVGRERRGAQIVPLAMSPEALKGAGWAGCPGKGFRHQIHAVHGINNWKGEKSPVGGPQGFRRNGPSPGKRPGFGGVSPACGIQRRGGRGSGYFQARSDREAPACGTAA